MTHADTLIHLVLNEGRKKLASIDSDAPETQRRRFYRRATAFEKSVGDQGGEANPVLHGSKEKSFSAAPFQSPRREISVKHLLPLLHFHKQNKSLSSEQREVFKKEYRHHMNLETNRMIKAVRRNQKKLVGRGTGSGGPTMKSEDPAKVKELDAKKNSLGLSTHDAWDHGYIGALPSYHGEALAGHMSVGRHFPPGSGLHPFFSVEGENRASIFLRTAVQNASFRLPEHMKSIPHEQVLAWSKTLRSTRTRGLQGGES